MTIIKKISIIIPVYNSEKFVLNCFKSIVKQTYKDYNVIIIDDGSNDNSFSVCQDFIQKNSLKNFRVYKKNNGGPSSARNYGLSKVKTEYICFVDCDDILLPNHLEQLFNKKSDLVMCGLVEKKNNKVKHINVVNDDIVVDNNNLYKYLIDSTLTNLFNSPCNKLYRFDIIKNNNILFDENLKIGEDLKFNIKYLEFCRNISLSCSNTYIYEDVNSSSLTSQFNEDRWDIEKKLFIDFQNFFIKKDVFKMYEKDINEFLLSSFTKTVYTLIKSDYKNKISYIKRMLRDDLFKNKKFSSNKLSYKVAKLSIKLKNYIPIYLFYKLRVKVERFL